MLVDLSVDQITVLTAMIAERQANGPTVTNSTLQAALVSTNASYKSPADWQSVTISTTTLSIERRGKFNYVRVRGASTIATIEAITNDTNAVFEDGDEVTVAAQAGFWLYCRLPTQPLAINCLTAGNFVRYTMVGGQWAVSASNPEIRRVIAQPLERIAVTDATLAASTDCLGVRFIAGETPSGGSVTIGTSGTSGTVSAYVDEGFGSILLGTYTYSGSPSTTDVATGLAAAINAGYVVTHNYAASSALGVVTVIPPAGAGSLADSYLLSSADTGDCISVAAGFGLANGGTDAVAGSEADGAIMELLTPAIDGTVVEITNEMSANTLTLDKIAGVGNFATGKILAAKETCRVKFNSYLSEWTHIV